MKTNLKNYLAISTVLNGYDLLLLSSLQEEYALQFFFVEAKLEHTNQTKNRSFCIRSLLLLIINTVNNIIIVIPIVSALYKYMIMPISTV